MDTMRQSRIEVICYDVIQTAEGIGATIRCEDTTVHLGDTFTAVYRLHHWRVLIPDSQFEGDYMSEGAIEEVHECALTVERIERYEKDYPEARGGDTARFTLSGTGGEYVREGWILGTIEQATAPQNWHLKRHGVT